MKKLLALLLMTAIASPSVQAGEKPIKLGLMFGLTGTASPIGPVQLDGAKLAIKEANAAGGIQFGGAKRQVEFIVRDDETKPDAAIRRFRDFVNQDKVDAVIGQSLAPISGALNQEVKRTKVAYFPVNVVSLDLFTPQELAESTFAIHGCAYSAGYASAVTVVKRLEKRKIVFFGPAYAFGQDQWKGAQAAFKELGVAAEYLESPVGTNDFTSYLTKIMEMNPEVVMLAHWGVDAINVLKQTLESGLKGRTTIFFNWMTNAFGSGVPPEALDGVYSLMSWYYDLTGFQDANIIAKGNGFAKKFIDEYGYPPDPYSVMAYDGTLEALRALSLAGTNDPAAIAGAILANPEFEAVKGKGKWRIDHQPVFEYGAFIVVGKGAAERKDKWDLVKVIGSYTGDDFLPSLTLFGY
ncbi:MAG: ABC transporter substrate-binding protein [Planctomycetota bacterium]|jgi:branched-chain amino acid transport system substrate-binding protein|nr:ABC transporter substrate-binding protein [Planctomycetota bacterium]